MFGQFAFLFPLFGAGLSVVAQDLTIIQPTTDHWCGSTVSPCSSIQPPRPGSPSGGKLAPIHRDMVPGHRMLGSRLKLNPNVPKDEMEHS